MSNFSQNAKMKKTSELHGIDLFNFGIPAFKSKSGFRTCPNAGVCATGCYAQSGAYVWSNVQAAYERRLELTLSPDFVELIGAEIECMVARAKKKKRQLVLRIHDSGDFYSPKYQLAWYHIAKAFPDVQFYAYTKQVAQSVALELKRPPNFVLIFSQGGRQDHLISGARHSKVFETETDLVNAGYDNASKDDSIAWLSKTGKIGLVYHGAKSFKNTQWEKAV